MACDHPHLVIGTPCTGRVMPRSYVAAILDLQQACRLRDIGLTYRMPGCGSTVRGLDAIIAEFMGEPGATHLLLIGADVRFQPDDVFTLLQADKEIAGSTPDFALIRRSVFAAPSDGGRFWPRTITP